MSEFRNKIQEWRDFIEKEDLPNISTEIEKGRKNGDNGCVNYMRTEYSKSKRELEVLNRVLTLFDFSQTAKEEEQND